MVGSSIFKTDAAALPSVSVAKTINTSSLTPGDVGDTKYGLLPVQ